MMFSFYPNNAGLLAQEWLNRDIFMSKPAKEYCWLINDLVYISLMNVKKVI